MGRRFSVSALVLYGLVTAESSLQRAPSLLLVDLKKTEPAALGVSSERTADRDQRSMTMQYHGTSKVARANSTGSYFCILTFKFLIKNVLI